MNVEAIRRCTIPDDRAQGRKLLYRRVGIFGFRWGSAAAPILQARLPGTLATKSTRKSRDSYHKVKPCPLGRRYRPFQAVGAERVVGSVRWFTAVSVKILIEEHPSRQPQ